MNSENGHAAPHLVIEKRGADESQRIHVAATPWPVMMMMIGIVVVAEWGDVCMQNAPAEGLSLLPIVPEHVATRELERVTIFGTNLMHRDVVPGQCEKDWHSACHVYRDQPQRRRSDVRTVMSLKIKSYPGVS
jgi:hypothetical protein